MLLLEPWVWLVEAVLWQELSSLLVFDHDEGLVTADLFSMASG